MTTAPPLPASNVAGLRAVQLSDAHEPLLQAFFEANPDYAWRVEGQAPAPGDAHDTLHDDPPPGWSFSRRWVIGYLDPQGELVAMASVVSDLLAETVWHIGLFMLASSRHGSGLAVRLYQGLEDWARNHGAAWLRLGVVVGNVRAERFWASRGFIETRRREGVEMGQRVHTLRVMHKPLRGGTPDEYLARVPRDRPDPPPLAVAVDP